MAVLNGISIGQIMPVGEALAGTLMLEDTQIAEFTLNEGVIQTQLAAGYSEEKLCALISESGTVNDSVPAEGGSASDILGAFLSKLVWLYGLKMEFDAYRSEGVGGMMVISFPGEETTVGIPAEYVDKEDAFLFQAVQWKIDECREKYGEDYGLLIFRSENDFKMGKPFTVEEIR